MSSQSDKNRSEPNMKTPDVAEETFPPPDTAPEEHIPPDVDDAPEKGSTQILSVTEDHPDSDNYNRTNNSQLKSNHTITATEIDDSMTVINIDDGDDQKNNITTSVLFDVTEPKLSSVPDDNNVPDEKKTVDITPDPDDSDFRSVLSEYSSIPKPAELDITLKSISSSAESDLATQIKQDTQDRREIDRKVEAKKKKKRKQTQMNKDYFDNISDGEDQLLPRDLNCGVCQRYRFDLKVLANEVTTILRAKKEYKRGYDEMYTKLHKLDYLDRQIRREQSKIRENNASIWSLEYQIEQAEARLKILNHQNDACTKLMHKIQEYKKQEAAVHHRFSTINDERMAKGTAKRQYKHLHIVKKHALDEVNAKNQEIAEFKEGMKKLKRNKAKKEAHEKLQTLIDAKLEMTKEVRKISREMEEKKQDMDVELPTQEDLHEEEEILQGKLMMLEEDYRFLLPPASAFREVNHKIKDLKQTIRGKQKNTREREKEIKSMTEEINKKKHNIAKPVCHYCSQLTSMITANKKIVRDLEFHLYEVECPRCFHLYKLLPYLTKCLHRIELQLQAPTMNDHPYYEAMIVDYQTKNHALEMTLKETYKSTPKIRSVATEAQNQIEIFKLECNESLARMKSLREVCYMLKKIEHKQLRNQKKMNAKRIKMKKIGQKYRRVYRKYKKVMKKFKEKSRPIVQDFSRLSTSRPATTGYIPWSQWNGLADGYNTTSKTSHRFSSAHLGATTTSVHKYVLDPVAAAIAEPRHQHQHHGYQNSIVYDSVQKLKQRRKKKKKDWNFRTKKTYKREENNNLWNPSANISDMFARQRPVHVNLNEVYDMPKLISKKKKKKTDIHSLIRAYKNTTKTEIRGS